MMSDAELASSGFVIGLATAVFLLLAALGWYWWKKRKRSSISDALAAVAVAHIEDVLLPDGMGGEIQIEHLLLTGHGILIVDVKRFEGVVFASERMDQWTVIGPSGRSTFPNPLGSLYDRIAAVRQLVRDIEVQGFVVFPALADFSKGRPEGVLLPDDLVAGFARPDQDDIGRLNEAFAPHWERLREAAEPASR